MPTPARGMAREASASSNVSPGGGIDTSRRCADTRRNAPGTPSNGRAWMVHCYSAVGVGRGNADNSGNGSSLYAIIGSAARLLDRNITVVGRVVQGIEKLSVLPRGTGTLGFYEKPEQHTPIRSVRLAADVPPADRTELEALRTDSETFRQMVENRRHRRDDWYKEPAGHVDVCNVPLPIRNVKSQGG